MRRKMMKEDSGVSSAQAWGLKGHAPLFLVLVIDDNLYGLMVSLSYTLRFVHRQRLKIIWWLQGCKMKITC